MGRQEEDVSSYWITFRKREDTGNLRTKRQFAHCVELTLEEIMVLS